MCALVRFLDSTHTSAFATFIERQATVGAPHTELLFKRLLLAAKLGYVLRILFFKDCPRETAEEIALRPALLRLCAVRCSWCAPLEPKCRRRRWRWG